MGHRGLFFDVVNHAITQQFCCSRSTQYNTNRGCCAWVKPTLSHISTMKSINFWLLNDLDPRWCRHPSLLPHLLIDWVNFLDVMQNQQICCQERTYSIFTWLPSTNTTRILYLYLKKRKRKTQVEIMCSCQNVDFKLVLLLRRKPTILWMTELSLGCVCHNL